MPDRQQIAAPTPAADDLASLPSPRATIVRLFLAACGASLLLYSWSLIYPVIHFDDFQILAQSWTWQRSWEGLWVPQNEHAMPLGRLFSFGLEALAGRPSNLPSLSCRVGLVALLLGLSFLYVFIRRELGHPFYALLAVILFGVTSVYHQSVWWFAASFAVLSLDTMLLGLLAAQRWRQSGRRLDLSLCVLACLLAPGWFALGILAGPLCSLYLLFPRADNKRTRLAWLGGLLPLAGTALFLAISLPRTAQAIMHTGHYRSQTAVQAFHPLIGLQYTARSLVDNLLLGLLGISGVTLPVWCIVVILSVVVAGGVWWWRHGSDHRLMLLGLGLIGSSYLLCYSARSLWIYEAMVLPSFARYHLLPQLGLVLFFCGGLPAREGRWFALDTTGTITPRQQGFLYALICVCCLVQLPRGLIYGSPAGLQPQAGFTLREAMRDQQAALRRIEEVEARCRQCRISAAAARQALGRLNVPLSLDVIDGWDFLIGSDDPLPLSPAEVKSLLKAR